MRTIEELVFETRNSNRFTPLGVVADRQKLDCGCELTVYISNAAYCPGFTHHVLIVFTFCSRTHQYCNETNTRTAISYAFSQVRNRYQVPPFKTASITIHPTKKGSLIENVSFNYLYNNRNDELLEQ